MKVEIITTNDENFTLSQSPKEVTPQEEVVETPKVEEVVEAPKVEEVVETPQPPPPQFSRAAPLYTPVESMRWL